MSTADCSIFAASCQAVCFKIVDSKNVLYASPESQGILCTREKESRWALAAHIIQIKDRVFQVNWTTMMREVGMYFMPTFNLSDTHHYGYTFLPVSS